MSKEWRKHAVPELRFPEFLNSAKWEKYQLSHFLTSLDAGVSVNSGDRPATTIECGVLKTSAVTNGIFDSIENKVVLDPEELVRLKESVRANTIIISRMNTPALVGANAFVDTSLANIYLPDRLWSAKPKPKTVMRFVASILGSVKGRAALAELATGTSGSMKNITKSDVLGLPIVAPSTAEQQKIADCLASIDDLIKTQAQKLGALKAHKKGLMQQLFPAEGEAVPKLRFPEFRGTGEWVVSKLSSLVDLISGMHLSPEQYSDEGVVPYFTGPSDFTGGVQGVSKWTDESESAAELDDTLITVKGSGVGQIWYLTLPRVAMGRQLMAVRPTQSSSRFVYQFLLTKRTRFEDLASGNLIPGLSRGDILDIEARFPVLLEQQKIANCLTSVDEIITAQSKKIDLLEAHKKGLMQQLFPVQEARHE